MGNFKVTSKNSTGQPVVNTVVPVKDTWNSRMVPRYQFIDGTIVESVVDKDGTNTQTFMDGNGNRRFDITINAQGDSSMTNFDPEGFLFYERPVKRGSEAWKVNEKKANKYGLPVIGYEEASANYDEVKNQMKQFQEGGEVPSNDQQQQLFVSIITDMANVLGVEPSQELAEAVMTAFENNDDSQGLITLFTQIKDKRMSETGLFREGGKMNAFVSKFKCGGKAKNKTSKKQEGGEVELTTNYDYTNGPDLTRRQARKIAEVNKGADRADFRKGMQNARRHFDDRGLRGADKRNAARRLVAGLETANRTFTPPVAPAPELNVQLPVIETPAELQLKAREVVEPTPVPVTPNAPTVPTKPTTPTAPTKPVVSTPVTITGSPTVGGNYYDPNTNPWYRLGAKWGERARARREERRKNGERSFLQQLWDPHPEPLPTHDRKAAASGMVDNFLNTHSPRAKARK